MAVVSELFPRILASVGVDRLRRAGPSRLGQALQYIGIYELAKAKMRIVRIIPTYTLALHDNCSKQL